MERQRREEELKSRSSKKGHEAEQAILNRVSFYFREIFIHVAICSVCLAFCLNSLVKSVILFFSQVAHRQPHSNPELA